MYSIQQRLALATEPIVGAAWQWACMIRCATPGIVVSFDPIKQTCVVQPAIMEEVLLPPPGLPPFADGTLNTTQNIPTKVAIAPIQDVPIIMMRVPGWSITLPIVPGTECLLIFADSCIDGWWQSGGVQPQFDRRRHDLSDAFALFGPWSQQKLLTDYSTTSMQIRSDDQTVIVDLATTGITITAPLVKVQQDSSGVPLKLMNDIFYQWYVTNIQPFLVSKGYGGPSIPIGSETSALEAQ